MQCTNSPYFNNRKEEEEKAQRKKEKIWSWLTLEQFRSRSNQVLIKFVIVLISYLPPYSIYSTAWWCRLLYCGATQKYLHVLLWRIIMVPGSCNWNTLVATVLLYPPFLLILSGHLTRPILLKFSEMLHNISIIFSEKIRPLAWKMQILCSLHCAYFSQKI